MRVLKIDLDEGLAELVPESVDDLWHLMNILRPGDLVEAKTSRTVKIRGSMGEVEGRTRLSLRVKLKVEAAQLDLYVKRLRIQGVIVESSEGVEGLRGRHHSINLRVGEVIRLFKERWLPNELERIEMAKGKGGRCLVVVSIDGDECCIAAVREYGLDVRAEIPTRLPGKRGSHGREDRIKRVFAEVSKKLGELDIDEECLILVIGPGFLCERLAEHLRTKPGYKERVRTGKASIGGLSGVYEALRSGVIAKYLGEARVIYEAKLLDEALEIMAKNPDIVTYGIRPVEELAPIGAIKTLLVSERLLKNLRGEELDRFLDAIKEVERKGGRVVFISSGFENLDKISGFGGVIAILRYPVTWGGAAASP